MKKLKTFESFVDDEEDDELSLKSYYLSKLKTFKDRLDNAKTEEDVIALDEDAEEYEKYTDLEEIGGEWSDFKVFLSRKKEEMGIIKFKSDIINELVKKFKSIKSEPDLEKLVEEVKELIKTADKQGEEFEDELHAFTEYYNENVGKIIEKIK